MIQSRGMHFARYFLSVVGFLVEVSGISQNARRENFIPYLVFRTPFESRKGIVFILRTGYAQRTEPKAPLGRSVRSSDQSGVLWKNGKYCERRIARLQDRGISMW